MFKKISLVIENSIVKEIDNIEISNKKLFIESCNRILNWCADGSTVPSNIELLFLFGHDDLAVFDEARSIYEKNNSCKILITGGKGRGTVPYLLYKIARLEDQNMAKIIYSNLGLNYDLYKELAKQFDDFYEHMQDIKKVFKNNTLSEVSIIKAYLQGNGINSSNIYIEEEATNTLENVVKGYKVLEENSLHHANILLMQTPVIQLRSRLTTESILSNIKYGGELFSYGAGQSTFNLSVNKTDTFIYFVAKKLRDEILRFVAYGNVEMTNYTGSKSSFKLHEPIPDGVLHDFIIVDKYIEDKWGPTMDGAGKYLELQKARDFLLSRKII